MPNATAEDPKRAILIAALHPQPGRFAALLQRHSVGLDWTWLLERAVAHKVTPLLASRVAIEESEAYVPDDIRERLRAAVHRPSSATPKRCTTWNVSIAAFVAPAYRTFW